MCGEVLNWYVRARRGFAVSDFHSLTENILNSEYSKISHARQQLSVFVEALLPVPAPMWLNVMI
jgi:hypothetical protein